jgi:hypothetical protein
MLGHLRDGIVFWLGALTMAWPCRHHTQEDGLQALGNSKPCQRSLKFTKYIAMSGSGQPGGAHGAPPPITAPARTSNLQLDATVRALEHSHLTSRPLSLHDFVLTSAPSSLGKDVILLYARCTRAGLPQSDKTYLLKVGENYAERLTVLSSSKVHISVPGAGIPQLSIPRI